MSTARRVVVAVFVAGALADCASGARNPEPDGARLDAAADGARPDAPDAAPDAAPPEDAAAARDAARDAAPQPPIAIGPAFALSSFGGTYPRAAALAGGAVLLAFDSGAPNELVLRTARSGDDGASFDDLGVVARHPVADRRTLGNVHPLQLPSGTVLCAFRHHDLAGGTFVHRLLVAASDDGGRAWRFRGEIEVNTSAANGIWEPFLRLGAGGAVEAYYARERAGGDQDIVVRRSSDGGASFGPLAVVATQAGSRDGMPAVARLRDGSLVALFESFRSPGTPRFVVRSVQSNDGGRTWGLRHDVYVPASGARNAGAPFVVALPDGRLLASFMTDEDSATVAWPARASMKILLSDGVPTHGRVRWQARPLAVDGPEAYWPSLFVTPGSGDVLALYDRAGLRARRVRVRPLDAP